MYYRDMVARSEDQMAHNAAAKGSPACKKVLLVDDAELFLQLQKSFLQRSDIRIYTAKNGQEALQLACDIVPDLVFLDVNMPVMDGDECCLAMRREPRLKHSKIVMVTTAGRPQDQARCHEAGCDDILLKPVKRTEFLAAAQKYLRLETRDERFKGKIQVQYGPDREQVLASFSVNISSGGLYIRTDSPLPEGQPLLIRFAIPDPNKRLISCHAEVVWVNAPDEQVDKALPPGMGVRFIDLSANDLLALRSFMVSGQLETL